MQTERNQVGLVGMQISELKSDVDSPTLPIKGTMHGLIEDLTFEGIGAYDAPVNVTPPSISGDTPVGSTLTVVDGTWISERPIDDTTREWRRDGVAISGANGATYVTVEADEGTDVTCAVTQTSDAGSTTAVSNAITVTAAG